MRTAPSSNNSGGITKLTLAKFKLNESTTLLLKVVPLIVNVPCGSEPVLTKFKFAPVQGPFNPPIDLLHGEIPKFPNVVELPKSVTLAEKFCPLMFTVPCGPKNCPLVMVALPVTTIGSAFAVTATTKVKLRTTKNRSSLIGERCRRLGITNLLV
jgi:hypothetical protein